MDEDEVRMVDEAAPRATKKRFLMLALFCLYSMTNSFQWIQYAIITDITAEYYGISNFAVNWTSVIYMIVYIPLIFPASSFLEKKGLRTALIVGALINFIAAAIKCFSVNPNYFWVTMIGQTLASLAQLFVLNVPPMLAAVWFPNSELSTATAFGVFGNQLGIAVGFIVPTVLVTGGTSTEVATQLGTLSSGVAVITALTFLLILFLFQEKPQQAPSIAQSIARVDDNRQQASFTSSLSALLRNKDFDLLVICYGIISGIMYALSTLLNQILAKVFPGDDTTAGIIGVLYVISGIFGATLCGYILDRTRLYKEITFGIYLSSFLSFLLLGAMLHLKLTWALYIASALLGFSMTGYLPLGFEFAAEITFPEPEGTSAGLLNASAQLFGIILTFGGSFIVDNYGNLIVIIVFSCMLLLGVLLSLITKADLRRQRAENEPTIN